MATTTKGPKKLERHFKGVANHTRIRILSLLSKEPGLTLAGITERLNGNLKTISEHTRRLAVAGLIEKVYERGETCITNFHATAESLCALLRSLPRSSPLAKTLIVCEVRLKSKGALLRPLRVRLSSLLFLPLAEVA